MRIGKAGPIFSIPVFYRITIGAKHRSELDLKPQDTLIQHEACNSEENSVDKPSTGTPEL
jgi:hypothetical protein